MVTLETERCILRPFEAFDISDFFEYAKNPRIGPNAGWPPHNNIEESRKILESFMEMRRSGLSSTRRIRS